MSDIGPGDLVVCVDASLRHPVKRPNMWLSEGVVYKVKGLFAAPDHLHESGQQCLSLFEQPSWALGAEIDRFRKFDEGDSARLSAKLGLNTPIKIGEMA